MKGKKGEEVSIGRVVGGVVVAVIGLMVLVAIYMYNSDTGGSLDFLNDLPSIVTSVLNVLVGVFGPVIKGIYWVVTPEGQPENVQMIAFSIFILLALVGHKSLKPFFGQNTSLIVSVIAGIIAARSLTEYVLEETALAASPIATVSLLLGLIPVFALTQFINKWGLTEISKAITFVIFGLIYWFVFAYAFNSMGLGLIYGIGIVLIGVAQVFAPYIQKVRVQKDDEDLGVYMQSVHEDIKTMRRAKRAAATKAARAGSDNVGRV